MDDASLDWTGSWQSLTLRIGPDWNGAPSYVVVSPPYPTGVVQASAKFTHNESGIYQPMSCKGELPTQTYRGAINLLVHLKPGETANKISFNAQAQDTGMAFDNALDSVIKARCQPKDFTVHPIPGVFPFSTPDGISFDFGELTLNWDRTSSSPSEIPFPLDQIFTGKSTRIPGGAFAFPIY